MARCCDSPWRCWCGSSEASGSRRLIDITQAHLVGSYDSGAANLALLEKVAGSRLRVAVPTTLNAGDIDLRQMPAAGEASPGFRASCRIGHLLQAIGCRAELTYSRSGGRPAVEVIAEVLQIVAVQRGDRFAQYVVIVAGPRVVLRGVALLEGRDGKADALEDFRAAFF
jgi:hypothetical protein